MTACYPLVNHRIATAAPPGGPGPAATTAALAAPTMRIAVSGTARAAGAAAFAAPYNPSADSPGPDQPVSVGDQRTGHEDNQSCGAGWTNSYAASHASVQPVADAGSTAGFTVSVAANARGGFWRAGVGVGPFRVCRGSNNTSGNASATAIGRANITAASSAPATDQLLVMLTGDVGQLTYTLTDARTGQPVHPTTTGPAGAVYNISLPGSYTFEGDLSTSASGGGGCPGCGSNDARTVHVMFRSARALASLTANTLLTSDFAVPLPLFIPRDTLLAAIRRDAFTDQGRIYPCKNVPGACGDYGSDVYIEQPALSTAGGFVRLSAHISGHAGFWAFKPGVTGTVSLSGVPQVSNDVITFQGLAVDLRSRNGLVNALSTLFPDALQDAVARRARFDLGPRIHDLVAELQKKGPPQIGGACLLLDLKNVHLRSVAASDKPEGVVATVGVAGSTSVDPSQCKTPAAAAAAAGAPAPH